MSRHSPRHSAWASHGDTMSMATRTDTQSPALHVADSHDYGLIRVHGARENNPFAGRDVFNRVE
jgi:hypothetical protein